MTTAVWTDRLTFNATSFAEPALKAAARFWFVVAVAGQLIFAFAVASFYGSAVVRGNLKAWNRSMAHRYVEGDPIGNSVFAVHLLAAVVIMLSGALQLVPRLRERAPSFHRWNGRLYVFTAFTTSFAGLYLAWVRGTPGDLSIKVGTNLMALLILVFAAWALRSALARDFRAHRRWALRLFLAVSAGWFFRLGFALWLLVFQRPVGFDPKTFTGPFLTFLSFAQYLVPLAVLELYLRARDSSAPGRMAMAAALSILTVVMGVGIFAATMVFWQEPIKAAFDGRKSIAEALSTTIASRGIDAAVQQYRDLKATAQPGVYNFDERELRVVGRELMDAKRFKEAVRILTLNVEAYPGESKAFDRLGEAYLGDGNKPQALANYEKALALDAKNTDAVEALRTLR